MSSECSERWKCECECEDILPEEEAGLEGSSEMVLEGDSARTWSSSLWWCAQRDESEFPLVLFVLAFPRVLRGLSTCSRTRSTASCKTSKRGSRGGIEAREKKGGRGERARSPYLVAHKVPEAVGGEHDELGVGRERSGGHIRLGGDVALQVAVAKRAGHAQHPLRRATFKRSEGVALIIEQRFINATNN
eukprot:652315-Prorocentrum_minimum.AAC.3